MDILRTGTSSICSSGPIATSLIGIITLCLLLYHSWRKQSYWKRLGIPYVKPYPFIGNLLEQFRKTLQDIEVERYKIFGRIYGHFEFNTPLLSVAEPELIRSILVKDFQKFTGRKRIEPSDEVLKHTLPFLQGEKWKRVRSIVTPTFTTGKLKRMMGIFKECSKTLVGNFKKAADKGKHVDAKSFYGAFTMDVIASSAFSTKIDSHNDPNNEFVVNAKEGFTTKFSIRLFIAFFAPKFGKFFGIGFLSPKAYNFFISATKQIIEERKKTGQTRNDFMQLLLDTAKEFQEEELKLQAKDNDMTENYGNEENNDAFKTISKQTLSFEEIVAQCIIFFLAGYDTIANTVSFATYCLALNPEVQERVIKELDDALRENNGDLTYEILESLQTLDNVISETLRLFPPAARTDRVAEEDYMLADTGIIIPKGMDVTIPIYAIHRDPEHFPDPEKFDPDRFTPKEKAKRHPYAYLPFGAGPRNCVARRFALLEIKVCLVHVLSHFRIKMCSKTKVPLDFYLGQGFLLPKEVYVQFEIRKDTVCSL